MKYCSEVNYSGVMDVSYWRTRVLKKCVCRGKADTLLHELTHPIKDQPRNLPVLIVILSYSKLQHYNATLNRDKILCQVLML